MKRQVKKYKTTLKYKQENAKSYDDRPISFTK